MFEFTDADLVLNKGSSASWQWGAHLPQTLAGVTSVRCYSSPPAAGVGRGGTVPTCWDATQQSSAKPLWAGLRDGSTWLGRHWGSRGCQSDSAHGTAQLGCDWAPGLGLCLGLGQDYSYRSKGEKKVSPISRGTFRRYWQSTAKCATSGPSWNWGVPGCEQANQAVSEHMLSMAIMAAYGPYTGDWNERLEEKQWLCLPCLNTGGVCRASPCTQPRPDSNRQCCSGRL